MNLQFSKSTINQISRKARSGKFLSLMVTLFLGVAFAACHNCDDRAPVLPPSVSVAANTLSGVVTDMQGNPISGAVVTINGTQVTTGADGTYIFNNVPKGRYEVIVTASGMFPQSTTVNFAGEKGQNLLWSISMNKINTQNLVVSNAQVVARGNVESENIPNNEEGGVTISVDVPANTVPSNTTIYITPIYDEEDAENARASETSTMLIGATLSCSNPNLTLTSPIDVKFALDNSVITSVTVMEYDIAKDKWTKVNPEVDANGNVVVKATKFTSYGVFLPTAVTIATTSEEVKFDQSVFDNRDSFRDMVIDNAYFTYKAGTQIVTNAQNKLQGLLIEYLARVYGSRVTEMNGTYALNATLHAGQGLKITGKQSLDEITVSSGSTSVKGTKYGNVTVSVATFSTDHNGGTVGNM